MIWTAIKAFFGDLPVLFWLIVAIVAGALLYHVSELDNARQIERLKLKADIEAAAAAQGRKADSAAQDVLGCAGTWNRSTGRCER